jgi:Ran GTPase-activating protein (RanGAP) involved in mRNA processing and transport
MGPKKAAAKSEGEEEDISCEQLMKAYRKNCQTLSCEVNKQVKAAYDSEWTENLTPIKKFHLWDDLGWQGVKALFDAACTVNYKHCSSVRLWRSKCEDEGVRLIVKFMTQAKTVQVLELLDAQVTAVGCEMLGRALLPQHSINLLVLKMDHNAIGAEGLRQLAVGICQNKQLTLLSLTFCQIDETAAETLFQIAVYQCSTLTEMNLSGNPLREPGLVRLCEGLACAKSLEKIQVGACQFSDTPEVLDALAFCMSENSKLTKYDLKHNNITDSGVERLAVVIKEASHVCEVEVSEWINEETMTKLTEALAGNKPKKGKKGKK